MATDIELWRDGAWDPIGYGNFSIDIPTSALSTTPSAKIETHPREQIDANQDCRIVIDGTTVFEGATDSAGTVRRTGQVSVSVSHQHDALFAERVTVDLSGTVTAEDVLDAALTNATQGDPAMLDWSGSDVTLDSGYNVENRQLTAVFRDMTDRTGRLWWVDPAGDTINVQPTGDRGTWQSLDAQADKVAVQSFDDGKVGSVRNDVTVVATAEEAVEGSAQDAGSISDYGRRSEEINIGYAATQAEAEAYASELLIPDPLAEGTVLVSSGVGDVTQPLANYLVDLSDDAKGVDESGMAIERQQIEQGRVTLELGEGSGVNIESVNRGSKSRDDTTEPGTVYGEDRIADDSIAEQKLQDLSVTVDKIEDEAVAEAKVRQEAISETKVQDDAISTPKLQAGSVTAGTIDTAAVDTIHLAADAVDAGIIEADAVGADEIAAGSITANEIDTLALETGTLSILAPDPYSAEMFFELYFPTAGSAGVQIRPNIDNRGILGTAEYSFELVTSRSVGPGGDDIGSVGGSNSAYSEMHAYAFIDADTGSEISDGGDPLAGLSDGHGPPDHCQPCDDDGNVVGTDISNLSKWLADICREQQRVIDDLEERLSSLEEQV